MLHHVANVLNSIKAFEEIVSLVDQVSVQSAGVVFLGAGGFFDKQLTGS
jgi:hypothetical protein